MDNRQSEQPSTFQENVSLEKITQISGRAVYVPGDDIDTDRIIPARFMKCVTFDGLGEYLFHDVRFDEKGVRRSHNLNDPRFAGSSILISGANFGCGSSREHAPQAIHKAGFRAVVAEGFAEIFFGNSTQLGIPCVSVSPEVRLALAGLVEADPSTVLTIDLVASEVRAADARFPCALRPGARDSLIQGKWDPIGDLLESSEEVDRVAAGLPYLAT